MKRVFLFVLTCAMLAPMVAIAQNIDRYVTVAPPAAWVEQVDRPEAPMTAIPRDIDYLLVDRQINHSASDAHRYYRYVEELGTPNGVENNSAITVDFDPAYQSVTFHHLTRIRKGEAVDILDPERFEAYRVETERDLLIYNGRLQLSYLIPDVRVGDVLDYAFTIHGQNPAIAPHFAGAFDQGYSVPVRRLRNRLVVSADTPLYLENHGDVLAPEIVTQGGTTSYLWDAQDLAAISVEGNVPYTMRAYPETIYTTFDSWQAVGDHFAPYYDVKAGQSDAIRDIAAVIRSEHNTEGERLRAALRFVQREVRYLGVALGGVGGFIPRDPDQVLRDRFGDCKDMTILLLAILADLGIEAQPLLVNSETLAAVDSFAPSYRAFDHVIVAAQIDGTSYYLDPTRGVQLGDLAHLQQGDFGKGLIVASNGPGIIETPIPQPEFYEDIRDTFDLVSEPGAVLLTSVSTYYKGSADGMLSWYTSLGPEAADRNFLEYFQGFYPQIEQQAPLELAVDEIIGTVTVTARYRIPGAWTPYEDSDGEYFYAEAQDLSSDMPSHVATARTLPYALAHPVRSRQTLVFELDDTWTIDTSTNLIENAAFRFSHVERFVDDVYVKEMSYQSRASEIAPDQFRATMDALAEAHDHVGVTLQYTSEEELDPIAALLVDVEDVETKINIWHLCTILISLIVALILIDREGVSKAGQRYYPVSLAKFTVLTFITAGLYPIYWSYMNWRWLKHANAQDISPGWRAFFSVFTNFNLFQRMAQTPDAPLWFRSAAMPLAVVILLGFFGDQMYIRSEEAPEALFLFGFLCMLAWLPVVSHVNRLNANHPEILQAHSRFGWPALGLIALFAPLTALVIYGFL